MSDDDGNVDPTSPQPKGHYGWFRDSPWYYVNDELVRTFILGPAANAGSGDNWILPFAEESAAETDHERVCVRLTSRTLHELYIETKDLSPDARQAGHTAECDLYGESVPPEEVIPNEHEEPVHKHYCVDTYGGPVWTEGYWAGFNQQSGVPVGRCWLRAWLYRE